MTSACWIGCLPSQTRREIWEWRPAAVMRLLDPALLRYVGSREPHPYASTRAAPTHMPRIMPWIISCCACSFWLPEFFASKRHSIDRDLQSWLLPALEPSPMKADVSCGRMGAQESRSLSVFQISMKCVPMARRHPRSLAGHNARGAEPALAPTTQALHVLQTERLDQCASRL